MLDTCTVCGLELRDGTCPAGHPQRAARSRRRSGRRRGQGRLVFRLIVVGFLLAAIGYVGLVWYPDRAAADFVAPVSEDFDESLEAYEAAVEAFPAEEEASEEALLAVLDRTDAARTVLSKGSLRLEDENPPDIPVVSSRPVLELASTVRDRMLEFYTEGLEVIGDLESSSSYLTQLAPVLPQLENLEAAVGNPTSSGEAAQTVAAARPIAAQIRADLRALTPPEGLSPLHARLLAIARNMVNGMDEIERAGPQGQSPVLIALVEDIHGQIGTFREEIALGADEARASGLDAQVERVGGFIGRITADLERLRSAFGLEEVVVPTASSAVAQEQPLVAPQSPQT